ncbi:flagellar biosynthesis protein FlhA [Granulosicoccus antarcticus]|uniref:Flagellar biosynthesis protein FlhA n=1 Tax=Granulosicoccus antarcticus IMCC3135 TaxID=1192854 RepID=A0A2Z2NVT6_9GAMM|nr:flagellar biosynthesis protein FlhA [Granulosicoccus antarcticus]ASJ71787.1 Flagellar biosynthesis protein FlhA [Granulosicoccus antarcticus IMCC3135]
MQNTRRFLRELQFTGLGAPFLVLLMLVMMVLPIPTIGLDLLFTFNIALSLIVLLVTVYTSRPLEFSSFPTVLLVATMLRLSLNIASTRVVLLEGHTGTASAGQVIESFGNFVIGGNYAVGFVVFAILVIINFVVVTKGAGRVSEVSARFVLDAMPGKQMAIDADLNAGLVDQDEARQRRADIGREADFYGSMDGASKFVKGDAIAGLLVLFINIIGGLAVGVGQHGLSFGEAAHNYTLLTIGDGLVAQIPSLLLSMGTAVIVTRVSAAEDMGEQISLQLFKDQRALVLTAVLIGALGVVPGMPNLVFLTLGAGLGTYAWYTRDKYKEKEEVEEVVARPDKPAELSWDDVRTTDILGLEVGFGLIPLVDARQGGKLPDRIKAVRRKLTEELGFLIHPVHIRDNLDLPPTRYRISILGVTEGEADLYADKELAIGSGIESSALQGINTKDPAYGMDAVWIRVDQRDSAQALGYTVVDPGTVIATHMSKLLMQHAGSLLGHQEVQSLLDTLKKSAPRLVEDLVPKMLPLPTVVKVLQNLLDEGIPVKDMRSIAETLAEKGTHTTDSQDLTAAVRVALRRQITGQLTSFEETLPVITLDAELEKLCLNSVASENSGGLGIEPGLAERLYQSLADSVHRQEVNDEPAVLLVSPKLRPWLAGMVRHTIPLLKVLAYNEIAENKRLKVIANIGGESIA